MKIEEKVVQKIKESRRLEDVIEIDWQSAERNVNAAGMMTEFVVPEKMKRLPQRVLSDIPNARLDDGTDVGFLAYFHGEHLAAIEMHLWDDDHLAIGEQTDLEWVN
ncbi:MAG: hypothetical protein AAGI92_10210 [Pseudomonadota bacterium]